MEEHVRDTGARSRWLALAALVGVQLVIMVDLTIVNVALPSAEVDLGMSPEDRQWVLSAYALPFGGLLLLGGRLSDRFGRRRMLQIGLIGFAVASAIGGFAGTPEVLFGARALQGLFSALMAPAVLSAISLLFRDGDERTKAFALFSVVSAGGGAMGLVLGGFLTEYVSWRWCLLVNLPIAMVLVPALRRFLSRDEDARYAGGYDVPGSVAATLAAVALVFAATNAGEQGWGASGTLIAFVVAAVLAVAFVLIERASAAPLLPLRVITSRIRAGAFAAVALGFAANTGMILLVLVYLQRVTGESAFVSGIAFLPFMVGAGIAAAIAPRLLRRLAPRVVMATGFTAAAAGVLLLSRLEVGSSYELGVLPGLVLDGFGVGLLFVPAADLAIADVADDDTGVASAAFNATQQIGAALGAAIVNSIAVSATESSGAAGPLAALADGTGHGLIAAACLMASGLVVAALAINARSIAPADGPRLIT